MIWPSKPGTAEQRHSQKTPSPINRFRQHLRAIELHKVEKAVGDELILVSELSLKEEAGMYSVKAQVLLVFIIRKEKSWTTKGS